MATTIIDYSFNEVTNVANPNGSFKAKVKGCTKVTGPGMTQMGQYPNAFHFSNGAVYYNVTDPNINFVFLIRIRTLVPRKFGSATLN